MFAQLNPATARRQRWLRIGSLAFHALVLARLLHTPDPQLLTANSVASGQNGKSITRLYWPSKSPDDSSQSSSEKATRRYRHQRLSHEKLMWKSPVQPPKPTAPRDTLARANAEDSSKTQTLSAAGHGAQAGPTYGTLVGGPFYGNEIRPALPIATSDPVVYPWQLPNSGGNEVIEITIDERGEIVRKTVIHSMGPKLDEKFLAALESWRFQPAMRNGVAIASKQDAIFHYRARG
jgi:TonB family protein